VKNFHSAPPSIWLCWTSEFSRDNSMFETITFASQNRYDPSQPPIDIGHLVEGMLFYQRVEVIADPNILRQLIGWFGPTRLMMLLDEGLLDVSYSESMHAMITRPVAGRELHAPIEISSRKFRLDELIRTICIDVSGKAGKGRRLARGMEPLINSLPPDPSINERAKEAMLDQSIVSDAAKRLMRSLIPEFDERGVHFNTEWMGEGFAVHTNLDFAALNERYHATVPVSHSSLNPAMLLSNLQAAERELFYASRSNSDLATSLQSSVLISSRIDNLLRRTNRNADSIETFTAFTIDDGRALREAVNSKRVNVDDVVNLLISAKQFKSWLADKPADADLIKEYYRAVSKRSFVEKLPGKTTRWFLMTGAGFVLDAIGTHGLGTAAAILISAYDQYYLDRLVRGWRPNQFVEEDLKPFVDRST
jgi:hypothetical protein